MRASESRLAAPVAPVTTLVSSLAHDPDRPFHSRDPRQNNDFTYAADQDGRQVPLGSHMRRMNPRDTKMTVLADVNIHRIVRRSTVFGAPYDPNALAPQDDETPRGLYFIFFSAKAMTTMEFLQQVWINTATSWASATNEIQRRAAGGRRDAHDPAPAGAASRPSTCCVAASTSSCRPFRRRSGSARNPDSRHLHHARPR
jgi:hypothetical protein